MAANIGQNFAWDAVFGAADYRVRAVDVNGQAFGNQFATPNTSVPLSDILGSGPPTPATYTLYVAARDGSQTLGAEASLLIQLEPLPAPSNLRVE